MLRLRHLRPDGRLVLVNIIMKFRDNGTNTFEECAEVV